MSIARQPLTTKVIHTATNEEVTVYASITKSDQKSGNNYRQFYAYLYLSPTDYICIGDLDIHVYDEACKREAPGYNCYLNESGLTQPHIYINYIANLSKGEYSHVGNALHELAFRVSVMLGFEGRVALQAVRETHYFHFKNGFRLNHDINYYLSLAEIVYNANGEKITIGNGDEILYLPKDVIDRKLKQFCPEKQISSGATETAEQNKWVNHFEQLMLGAQQRTMQYQIILALTKKYGLRIDYPVTTMVELFNYRQHEFGIMQKMFAEDKRETEYQKRNRSLYCKRTQQILRNGIYLLMQLLPADSAACEREFAEVLLGTMTLAMMYQDKKYKAQARYQNRLFCPENSLVKLRQSHKKIPAQIRALGKGILTDKTLPYSLAINTEFFPDIALVPGAQALLLRESADINNTALMTRAK